MTVFAEYSNLPEKARGYSIALGNFDGVHAGHRAVMEAAAKVGKMAVATFEPPPRTFFRPNDPPFRIFSPSYRNKILLRHGAELVYELPFNAAMSAMTDDQFVAEVLQKGLAAKHVAVGTDFRFGRGRMGDASRLSSLGRAHGFGVSVVEDVEQDNRRVSSTAIREAIIAGEPEKVATLLGTVWTVTGIVRHGQKRGKTIGFPTANINLTDVIHPKHGVYAVLTRLNGENKWLEGVANFGRTPTTGIRSPLLEVCLLDFEKDIYGSQLETAFIEFLRPELTFESVEKMVEAMHQDIDNARKVFLRKGCIVLPD